MIRVSISSLGSLLACCAIGVVLLAWVWSARGDMLRRRSFERRRRRCSLCFFEFLLPDPDTFTDGTGQEGVPAQHSEPMPYACPRCGAAGVASRHSL
jgi:hypothetical protein